MTHFEREIFDQPRILAGLLRSDGIREAANALKARDVRFVSTVARGSSGNAATFFAYLVSSVLGLPTGTVVPSLHSVHGVTPRASGGLAVGVSQSGRSEDVLLALKAYREGGAATLAVSNNPQSPLAAASDWHLAQGAGEELAVAATKTFTTQMMALALLVAHWSESAALLAALEAVPEAMTAVLARTSDLDRPAVRLTHASDLWVLARGLNYVSAAEAALKVKETSYIETQAYSTAEVLHGPVAAIFVNTPVLLFGLADATRESNLVTARRVRELGADLTVVSSDPELLALATTAFGLPEGLHPATETFLHVLAGQLLALRLVSERGLDPDAPRHLSKVTHTV